MLTRSVMVIPFLQLLRPKALTFSLTSPFVSAHFFLLTSYRFNSSPPFSFYFLSFFFLFSEDSLFSQVVLRLLYNFHEIAVSEVLKSGNSMISNVKQGGWSY